MEPIIIIPKTEQEYSFVMELLRRMKIKTKPVNNRPVRIPGVPCTREELIENIRHSEEEFAQGVPGTPHVEVMKQIDEQLASCR